VLVQLIDEGQVGGEYWITSGDSALTFERLGELTQEFMRKLGIAVDMPRFVSPDVVDRLIRPVFFPALSPAVARRFERLLQVSSYLSIHEPFPTDLPELQHRFALPALPDLNVAFMHSLNYWAQASGYLKRLPAFANG